MYLFIVIQDRELYRKHQENLLSSTGFKTLYNILKWGQLKLADAVEITWFNSFNV